MKKTASFIRDCVMILVITVAALLFLTNLMERKKSVEKYNEFFEEKQDYDVLFLGTSHVLDGISPMDLWDAYGITSYNLAGAANTLAVTYWTFMNALEYTTPKVVVLDAYNMVSKYKTSESMYSTVHNAFDAFPLSITKIKAVLDLLNDEEIEKGIADGSVVIDEQRIPMGLLWNYSVYHSRWSSLDKTDVQVWKWYNKGAVDKTNVYPQEIHENSEANEIEGIGVEYFQKIIDECKSRGIDVFVTYLPAMDGYQPDAAGVRPLVEQNGIPYINFYEEDCILPSVDYSDFSGHLNPSGAKKVTLFLGDFIVKQYGLENRHGQEGYESWDTDYSEYVAYRKRLLKKQEKPNVYWMLLNDPVFEVTVNTTEEYYESNRVRIDNIATLGNLTLNIVDDVEQPARERRLPLLKWNGAVSRWILRMCQTRQSYGHKRNDQNYKKVLKSS